MAYVISRLCRDCKDYGCVNACPTACIVEHRRPSDAAALPNQLFIDPDDCIDCNACVAECPWEAIYADADVPSAFVADIALNALVRERRQEFARPDVRRPPYPDRASVVQNKRRWGLDEG
ncbi:MAG TPA: 4Fe-4S dicluster domain-containing protein [Polyangiaceae bacterium]|nr:4Fe-4S dicluster domain-containing protein [Polyangiaceae bacterium]